MPVNFQSIQIQIREMGQQAGLHQHEQREKLALALQILRENTDQLDAVRARVDQVAVVNSSLRCAVPTDEQLTTQAVTPGLKCDYVLLSADGSQIIPSHHDAVEFGVINVGAIRFLPGQPYTPREMVQSQLLFYDSLYNHEGYPLTEEVVALMRDIAERRVLAELAKGEKLPAVTLTDGQLEVFGGSKQSREFEAKLDQYIMAMNDLAELGVVTGGYVDKPRSDLVVRLLDLMLLQDHELKQAGQNRRLQGIRDTMVFEKLLGPGQRSAIFAIHSKPSTSFEGQLAVHFFYVNVGLTGQAHLARVEIPAWVADDPSLVDLLHFALISQCRQMGSRPYPYVLHRAHEVAVVSLEEKKQLENMIQIELRRLNLAVEDISNKQFAKDLQPRVRHPS